MVSHEKSAVDAVMSGTTFNLDTYTELATGSAVIVVGTLVTTSSTDYLKR